MKFTIYEDPRTHKFMLLQLPPQFLDGDVLVIPQTDRWFPSHEDAVAALGELLNRDD